jgi:hypothetical protein
MHPRKEWERRVVIAKKDGVDDHQHGGIESMDAPTGNSANKSLVVISALAAATSKAVVG